MARVLTWVKVGARGFGHTDSIVGGRAESWRCRVVRNDSVIAFALALAFGGAAQAAPPAHDHDHAAHAAPAATAAPAQRWSTDAPLREGMGRVHEALDDLRHYEMGHMTADMARERALTVQDAIKSMFANCKLAPEPDAALHAILVPLLAAAQRLDREPTDMAAVAAMRETVAGYPRQFDDPKWTRAGDAEQGARHEHHEH